MPGISRRALLKADGGGVLSAYLLAEGAQTRPAHASPAADQLPLEDGIGCGCGISPSLIVNADSSTSRRSLRSSAEATQRYCGLRNRSWSAA